MITHSFKIPVVLPTGSKPSDAIEQALAVGAVAHVLKAKAADDHIPAVRAAPQARHD